jgi:RNA polymerase sigma-70 factor (sigma-E family)
MHDEAGFRDFVTARLAKLSGIAYLLAGDHHSAQDLVQTTLVKVARHWDRVSRVGAPEAYVRKALYHEFVSSRRLSRRREWPTATPTDRPGPRNEADDAIRRMLLREALAKLTGRQRAVIVLRFYEDLSKADIEETLGCTVGTVKSQTHHALGRLRALAPELAELIEDPQEASR